MQDAAPRTNGGSVASGAAVVDSLTDFLANCEPLVERFYRYWESKRGGRRMPSRTSIDPLEMGPFLSRIILVDVVDDERRFVYRVVGTDEVALRGRDPTGKTVQDAFFGPNAETACGNYQIAVDTKAPHFTRGPYTTADGRYVVEDTLFLPLSNDDEVVNMVISYSCPKPSI